MTSHNADFARFGIDPDDPLATNRLDRALFLSEQGVPDDDIRGDSSLRTLELRVWSRVFVGADDLMSIRDAAASLGSDPDEAARTSQLLGFASEHAAITREDAALISELETFAQLFGRAEGDQLIRLIGSSLARLAEALTTATRVTQETPMVRDGSYLDFLRAAAAAVADDFPRLAVMMDRILRYHILGLTMQSWSVDPDLTVMTMPRAVGFADMVGFTTRAGALSTSHLSAVIDAFEGRVSEAITLNGGRAVKFIGDEVFFAFTDADGACACALELLALAQDDAIPDVRVGMAYGDVVARGGDYFGPVVNLASRLVDVADSGTALVSEGLTQAALQHTFETMPASELKGVGDAVVFARLRS